MPVLFASLQASQLGSHRGQPHAWWPGREVPCRGTARCWEPAPAPHASSQLRGLGSDPTAPPPSCRIPLLVVALYRMGFPHVAVFKVPQYSPSWRELRQFRAHLWQGAVLGRSLVALVLATASEKFKGKKLPPISKAPWRTFSDHSQATVGHKCTR